MTRSDINAEKRRQVMGRSIKLGHCVCNPKLPCPCPTFKEKDTCLCAGEHVPADPAAPAARLTEHVRSAGCSGKISQKDLHAVLSRLPKIDDPRVLVGLSTGDDAGVYELTPDLLLVQTVDVFTPVVDDPFTFGRIAACNSLSDVYAMGGRPLTALSIVGFPIHVLPGTALSEILRGGMSVLQEAGATLLGGHSLDDEEVKAGFAVTGLVKREQLAANSGARPGDALILTKPLGTGIITLATQLGRASDAARAAAAASMTTLNKSAAEIMVRHGAHACTDVTGFGLLGHLARVVRESGVTAEIRADALPLLPDVLGLAAAGVFSGANERNAEYSADITDIESGVPAPLRALLFDAQTSGGLLIALPADRAEAALAEMRAAGLAQAALIGRITEASDGQIRVA
ncbi:MAG TPA: selenide, water dikinase SelD [Kiritimatiellia bacterium]|nr:selenide, water dikinase SelD [Kiritimatiellia bacterium]HRZ12073.1 selenide, water dikinase SelD [Kiritimatiellia bacterium]HSA18169.1 selenide, water dikinase SelD [Kiritimatiellia bacterium]